MASRTVPTIRERLQRMTRAQMVGVGLGCVVVVAFFIVFFTFERQIFGILEPAVNYIRQSSAGIAILASIMFATCIFPLFGYGVVSMVCGYVYGVPKGFIPAFIGDILGASCCFWLYRLLLHGYISRKFKDNIEYQELSKAVSKDGIWVLFLIRLSSFPFAVLNAYFGAMTKLPYWKFILTTAMSTPRLFLPIFIGHNISSLANPDISGRDRTLKWAANIIGIVIALVVGYYIYRHTVRRIKKINAGLSPDEDEDLEYGAQAQEHEQQQQQQQQSQFGNGDLTRSNQPFEDRDQNDTTTTLDMEEMKSYPGQISTQSKSVETIAVDLDDRGTERVDLEQGHKA